MADGSRTPAVSRAAVILALLSQRHRPLSVSAIARETELPRTSVQGICEALQRERMLTRGADGSYWIGPRVAELGAVSRLSGGRALRFGLLIPTEDNAYYDAMLEAAHYDLRAAGGELVVRQAGEDGATQRLQWQELIDDDIDVILVDAVDSHGFDDLMSKSRSAGIPVVAVGSRIDDVDASVTSDNTQAGLLAGHELALRLRGEASVAIIDGLDKNANADRVAGFTDAIRDHPQITVVAHVAGSHDNEASGRAAAERTLAEHPEVDGIFAVCDPIAFGVAEHLESLERTLPITSVDGRALAIDQILGEGPIIATAAQDPVRIVRTALDVARELIDGKRPRQHAIQLPLRLITAANAGGYEPWG